MESWSKDNFYMPSPWLFKVQKFWLFCIQATILKCIPWQKGESQTVQHFKDIIYKDAVLDPLKEAATCTLNLSQVWKLAG